MEQFTAKERELLIELLGRLQVNPLDENAAQTVALIQSIAAKINANTEATNGQDII